MVSAGFRMLTLDLEELVVSYPDPFALMHDLQGMAESAAVWQRACHLRKDVALSAAAIYKVL